MKVRINDDAHGYSEYNNYSKKGSWGSWVEKHRGQIFEVEEGEMFYRNGLWTVVTGDNKYPNGNGIHTSQATIVDEMSVETTFKEIPVNVPFRFYNPTGVVCVKIDDNNYMSLEHKGVTEQYKMFNIYNSHNVEVYPVKDFKVKFDTYVPKVVEKTYTFIVDNDRRVTIYKDGSVALESSYGTYIRDKSEVEKIIKWGKTNHDVGCGLTPDSELKIGCQKFTIKQIRDFTAVYNSFVSGETNA